MTNSESDNSDVGELQNRVDDNDYDYDYDDDDDDDYCCSDEDDDDGLQIIENNYMVLRESNIRKLQEDDIARVSNVLSVSPDISSILLRHFNWSVSKVEEAWFSDEEGVRKRVGLLENPVVDATITTTQVQFCEICLSWFPGKQMKSVACGHPYCETCWEGYIRTAINDGPGCLVLRCPHPNCRGVVGEEMINCVASDEHKKTYSRYLYRSYIEQKKDMKWCPAPGCECAVNFMGDGDNYNVTCLCAYEFCWNCSEEAHRPVNCDTVTKWILKNTADSNNMDWLVVNSRPCPNCKRPIEKNDGCDHITCAPPCHHQFCWICREEWKGHDERWPTGECNEYVQPAEDVKRRIKAKTDHNRFLYYYRSWQSNQWSRDRAVSDISKIRKELRKLSDIQCVPENLLKFITEAYEQIVEGRRVLKWTYAYGYILLEHNHKTRQLFEYLQGVAESSLENVEKCLEKELQPFLTANTPSPEFNHFQNKLLGLTRASKRFFENLVEALENGLSDVSTTDHIDY